MDWKLSKDRPLCPQICEQLCVHIALGDIPPGERLPSVRETALAAGVNPNTVQHAFELLEQQGVVYSVRGSGWYAAQDPTRAQAVLQKLLAEKTAEYFNAMRILGLSPQEVKNYVKEWKE